MYTIQLHTFSVLQELDRLFVLILSNARQNLTSPIHVLLFSAVDYFKRLSVQSRRVHP